MSVILLNLQSNQQIKLENDTPIVIGRENVKGCYDKRVSRNHGRITCTVDGKVRLLALHCNPCFFKRKGVPPVRQLNKDQEETLNEGDCLGLLPNAFWFKVIYSKDNSEKNELETSTISSDIISDEMNKTIVSTETPKTSSYSELVKVKKKPEFTISSNQIQNCSSINSSLTSVSKTESNLESSSKKYGTPEFEKTKRLPLWMYEIDDSTDSNQSTNKHSLESNQKNKGKKQKVLSETEIKKELEMQSDVNINRDMELYDAPSTSTGKNVDETTNSTSLSKVQEEPKKDDKEKEGYENSVDSRDFNSKRPICQYEGHCYRKNPQHKLEYSHPGDSDYIPYEERPLCQYGDACYRKSEKHRTEFRHPSSGSSLHSLSSPSHSSSPRASSPLPPKRTRKKVQNFYYEDDDEYDLEDPFRNDASSDEYLPSGLDSEEEDLDTSRE